MLWPVSVCPSSNQTKNSTTHHRGSMLTGLEFSSSLIATYSKEGWESGSGEVEESQGALKGEALRQNAIEKHQARGGRRFASRNPLPLPG